MVTEHPFFDSVLCSAGCGRCCVDDGGSCSVKFVLDFHSCFTILRTTITGTRHGQETIEWSCNEVVQNLID